MFPTTLLIGVDAQPIANLPRIAAFGGNLAHRYDPGPQKNQTLADWLAACRANGLKAMVQGTVIDAQNPSWSLVKDYADVIVAIAQDDEPDLARGEPRDPAWQIVSGPDAGRTKPEILIERYDRWKMILVSLGLTIPIICNFAGPNVSAWASGSYQKQILAKACDWAEYDWYVKNNHAANYKINFVGFALEMFKLWAASVGKTGMPVSAVIECSDQLLDRTDAASPGRGPTAPEAATTLIHVLAHGGFHIDLFPQRIFGGFAYWAMTTEVEAVLKTWAAFFRKHSEIVLKGTRTLRQDVEINAKNAQAGKWGNWEEVTWEHAGKRIRINLDLTGQNMPVLAEFPPDSSEPIPDPKPSDGVEKALKAMSDAVNMQAGIIRDMGNNISAALQEVAKLSAAVSSEMEKLARVVATQSEIITALSEQAGKGFRITRE